MNKYLLNLALILFLMFIYTACTKTQNIPDWALGEWEGSVGYEHDMEDYSIRLTLSKTGKNQIEYISKKCIFDIVIVSISENTIELNEAQPKDQCGPFGGGTIHLSKVDYFGPNTLHMEYYPKGKEELWLAQIERK